MGWAETIAGGLKTARAAMGVRIQYRRGDQSVDLADVGIGTTNFMVESPDAGTSVSFETRDYFIDRSKLVLDEDAGPVEPQRGDEIVQCIGGVENVYQVLSPDDATPVYRFSDPGQTQYRVHTKLGGST